MRKQPLLFFSLVYQWQSIALAAPPQVVLDASPRLSERRLHGRFLHITDMHPDPFYKNGTSQSSSCHRNQPKSAARSGYYGTPFSECDSPLRLTNLTLDFLEKNWSAEIDFVIWTGDSARHDNDRKIPRTTDEIYDSNRAVAKKMSKIFLSKGIPVIPSLGNNDIWRENIMSPGPNTITNEFSSIWSSFIPFASYQVFQRGAYYSVEVVPNALAVISLNTMYFYDANKGHVPPSSGNYFPECYYRYVELSLRYQDTILGHLFGHMNADHFFFLDAKDLEIWPEAASTGGESPLYDSLISDFEELCKTEEVNYDNYAVINVSPSVVPNPYVPSFRIYSYNITGLSSTVLKKSKRKHSRYHHGNPENNDSECRKEPYRDSWRCKLKQPWHSDSEAPSRRNTLWTGLGYAQSLATQYTIPNLLEFDEKHEAEYRLEYLTFPISRLDAPRSEEGAGAVAGDSGLTIGTAAQPPAVPMRNLPRSLREGDVRRSKYTPYEMEDLSIGSWVELGRRLGEGKEEKLRRRFKKYMYMGGEEG
ncbi:hypothetical protein SERLADRAFT_446757 [Serpula lacrymans var. lacrymans S7.9]|uniref:Calcineurin-like phosphoesterase domain-containing protein n=1 Tax=Serpula lacrymans var. lacrymans (strain S7.9) TaxID=578457 RepID=F8NN28_SERL9|nr:uncharacterized protein SERLADRAFT_446757 [Serpula lacrymans var. lacrymans S7.9]EGO27522.1 hypothetical protein SERLADRAFT_446757 [Serpula lacrymans var. lacrymans S7.9]